MVDKADFITHRALQQHWKNGAGETALEKYFRRLALNHLEKNSTEIIGLDATDYHSQLRAMVSRKHQEPFTGVLGERAFAEITAVKVDDVNFSKQLAEAFQTSKVALSGMSPEGIVQDLANSLFRHPTVQEELLSLVAMQEEVRNATLKVVPSEVVQGLQDICKNYLGNDGAKISHDPSGKGRAGFTYVVSGITPEHLTNALDAKFKDANPYEYSRTKIEPVADGKGHPIPNTFRLADSYAFGAVSFDVDQQLNAQNALEAEKQKAVRIR